MTQNSILPDYMPLMAFRIKDSNTFLRYLKLTHGKGNLLRNFIKKLKKKGDVNIHEYFFPFSIKK